MLLAKPQPPHSPQPGCSELWVSGKSILWRFVNGLAAAEATTAGATRKFVPREGRVTGRLDIHDIGIDAARRPIFVNTAYSCLATVSETAAFRPVWRPPFVSALIAEDRCHLNGLAMDGARPGFVTAIARSDVADGWRDNRRDGGIVGVTTSRGCLTLGMLDRSMRALHRSGRYGLVLFLRFRLGSKILLNQM